MSDIAVKYLKLAILTICFYGLFLLKYTYSLTCTFFHHCMFFLVLLVILNTSFSVVRCSGGEFWWLGQDWPGWDVCWGNCGQASRETDQCDGHAGHCCPAVIGGLGAGWAWGVSRKSRHWRVHLWSYMVRAMQLAYWQHICQTIWNDVWSKAVNCEDSICCVALARRRCNIWYNMLSCIYGSIGRHFKRSANCQYVN